MITLIGLREAKSSLVTRLELGPISISCLNCF